jgi:Gas vesicle synthesis protein GvpL/GvpF
MKKSAKKNTKKAVTKPPGSAHGLCYVYGIVRDSFDASLAPPGVDDTKVTVVRRGRIAALASSVPETIYGSSAVEENSGDVAWLSPRAMAHDRVLTWAQEHGGVIPMPMFSLWRSEEALSKSLASQASELTRVFERVSGADEFGLRVHRRDAVMLESIHEVDPEMAQLRAQAQAASPGQRYLLERKLADEGKGAVRSAAQRMAKQIFEGLRAISRDALSRPLTPEQGRVPDATLVLNGAFLVDHEHVDEFRAAVGAHVRDYQPRGLAFDFTGPWPPYNFVSQRGRAALQGAGRSK